jgi:hypothetical protein
MLRVKYIYNYEFRLIGTEVVRLKTPVACLVSDGERFGLSTCCKGSSWRNSDTFCKTRAKEIAIGRMELSELSVPNRKLVGPYGNKTTLLNEVNFWVERILRQTV